jgi:hypothetical protein
MGINIINGSLVNANARLKFSATSKSIFNATVPIDYDTELYNTGFTTDGAGNFTALSAGEYLVVASLDLTTTSSGLMRVYVNGSQVDAAKTSTEALHRIQSLVQLLKDDVVSIRFDNSVTMNSVANTNYVSITRVADYTAGSPVGFGIATADTYGLVKATKYQRKYLTANQTAVGWVSDLRFNNLEIGKTYRFTGHLLTFGNGTHINLLVQDGLTNFYADDGRFDTAGFRYQTHASDFIFTAEATTMGVYILGGSGAVLMYQNGSGIDSTYVQLEELPSHVQTTQWQ